MTDFKEFYQLMQSWEDDLNAAQKVQDLRFALMYCETPSEVRKLIELNIDFIDQHQECIVMFARRMNSIERVMAEKLKSYKLQLN